MPDPLSIPTRRMKRIFKWWWNNLPQLEQERFRSLAFQLAVERGGNTEILSKRNYGPSDRKQRAKAAVAK